MSPFQKALLLATAVAVTATTACGGEEPSHPDNKDSGVVTPPPPKDGGPDDCQHNALCVPDSGTDGGEPDAGTDAGEPDAGEPDSGTPDAGEPDAGEPDAGPVNDGGTDGGVPDAGPQPLDCSDQYPNPATAEQGEVIRDLSVGCQDTYIKREGFSQNNGWVSAVTYAQCGNSVRAKAEVLQAGNTGLHPGALVVVDPSTFSMVIGQNNGGTISYQSIVHALGSSTERNLLDASLQTLQGAASTAESYGISNPDMQTAIDMLKCRTRSQHPTATPQP